MNVYGTGADGPPTLYQYPHCCITWVPPGSPSADAGAAAAFVVPIATTTERHVDKVETLKSSLSCDR